MDERKIEVENPSKPEEKEQVVIIKKGLGYYFMQGIKIPFIPLKWSIDKLKEKEGELRGELSRLRAEREKSKRVGKMLASRRGDEEIV